MIRLRKSVVLQREIRQDGAAELAIPTWALVREAIQAGKTDEALRLLEYYRAESQRNNDGFASSAEMAYTYIAGFGEEEIEKLFRQKFHHRVSEWVSTTPGAEETLQRCAESQRGHGGNITITEESDRYVMRLDPCGTGGRLRRTRAVGTTKKAYPWSWSKSGVPYYCLHCCFMWEIIPIEVRGYPLRIVLPGDKPEDPCTLLFYKNPELIPEKYFTRVGKTKPKQ